MRAVLTLWLLVLVCFSPALATAQTLSFIRDSETEEYLRDLSAPVFAAAGIPSQSVQLLIVNDDALNAFVAGGMNIFLFTGLLQNADTPLQLLGVIAHETGHIASGDLVKGRAAMRQARAEAILATLLGVAAGAASGNAAAGAAIISGGQEVAARGFLAHSRVQESAADAAALRFLDSAKLPATGLLEFLSKLQDQELLPPERQSEYVRTHPLTADRLEAIRGHLTLSPYAQNNLPSAMAARHARMQAKLLGFMQPMRALQKYPASSTEFNARYARAIALFKQGELQPALALMDGLQREEPGNVWLDELRGQILFESGQVPAALPFYAKAAAAKQSAPVLQTSYAHALIESGVPANRTQAIDVLTEALRQEPDMSFAWRLLATAYGRNGNEDLSAYALAEEAAARGDVKLARQQMARAERLLPQGAPQRLRLLDLKAQLDAADEE